MKTIKPNISDHVIHSDDISIVVQGEIRKEYTEKCLKSLRLALPHSEIILSTWEGEGISNLSYDKVVLSEDPGAILQNKPMQILNNVNRQLVSTKAGLAICTHSYILKIRSDLILKTAFFLEFYGQYSAEAKHFERRLLVADYFTRNPRVVDFPFHISDWIIFGAADDVREYFNVPLQNAEDGLWFMKHAKKTMVMRDLLCRFVAEQHICLFFLHHFQKINCECYYDNSKKNIYQTERLLAEDFIVLDYQKQWNLIFPKYNPNQYFDRISLVSHKDWLELYYRYCLNKKGIAWRKYCFYTFLRRLYYGVFHTCAIYILGILRLKEKIRWLLIKRKY